jgi:tetratricopeptide (TPR) repeat protein
MGPKTDSSYVARRDTMMAMLLPLPEEDPALLAVMLNEMQKEGADSLCIPIFNKLLEINPADEYSRINLMQNALRNDDYEEVQRLCTDGLKENATQPLFYYFGGAGLMVAKKYEEALSLFERGRGYISSDTNTELVSSYYCSYGDALHQMGRNQEAYAMYDSALVYNNGNEMCLNNYAYFLSLDGVQLDKAERMSAYTVEMRPEEATFLDTYAWVLFLKGDYEKAREYIDKALANIDERADADNSSLYDHAGDIYWHLNLTAEAVDYWRQALKMEPDSQLIKKKVTNKRYYKD